MAHNGLSRADYAALRAQLDFRASWSGALATLALHAGTVLVGGWCVLSESLIITGIGQLLLGIAAFQAFAILHDCGHDSFTANRTVNVLIGHVVSTFCFMPFYSWRYVHQQHHVWAGNFTEDPASVVVQRWRERGAIPFVPRFVWRTWIPLIAVQQQLTLATYPLRMLRHGRLNRGKAIRASISVAYLVGSWVLVVLVLPTSLNIWPAIVVYLLLTELINVPHHVDRPTHDGRLPARAQGNTARSCLYPRGVSELVALNFNLHIEHHVFPDLPWYRLWHARSLLRPVIADYEESGGLSWVFKARRMPLERVALVRNDQSES